MVELNGAFFHGATKADFVAQYSPIAPPFQAQPGTSAAAVLFRAFLRIGAFLCGAICHLEYMSHTATKRISDSV